MKIVFNITGLFFLFLIVSCENVEISPKYHVIFDDNTIKINDVVSDINIIELDTISDAWLPSIEDLAVYEDKIFCFTQHNGGFVKVFDINGKYLFDIEHIGRANNEWIQLKTMFVDGEEGMVVLTDNESCKALIYDLNGNFIKSIVFDPLSSYDIAYQKGLFYSAITTFYTGDKITSLTNHKVNVYNESAELLKEIIPAKIVDSRVVSLSPSYFKHGPNGLIVAPKMDDTVYLIDAKNYVPYVTYEYKGNLPIYTEEDVNNAVEKNDWLMGDDKIYYSNLYVESPKYIIRRLGEQFGVDVIYDKQSGKTISTTFDFTDMGETHFSDHFAYPFPKYYYKDKYYGVLDIESFMAPESFLGDYVPQQFKKLEQKVRQNKNNQVLVSYKIKI